MHVLCLFNENLFTVCSVSTLSSALLWLSVVVCFRLHFLDIVCFLLHSCGCVFVCIPVIVICHLYFVGCLFLPTYLCRLLLSAFFVVCFHLHFHCLFFIYISVVFFHLHFCYCLFKTFVLYIVQLLLIADANRDLQYLPCSCDGRH